MRKLTIEFIKEKCREHGVECLEKEYVNNATKMRFRCKCGNEYEASWNKVTRNKQWQCLGCGKKNRAEKLKLDFNEIKKICREHGIECLEKEYINALSKMRFRCKCGNVYEARWNDVTKQNQWQCSECSGKAKGTIEMIKKICREHGIECLEKEYVNNKIGMRFRCKCGNIYEANWNTVAGYNQWQCPECSRKMSRGEKYAIDFFNKEGIQFKTQESLGCINPKTKKQLYYDFVIDKIIIEIDGEQHYKPVNFGTTEEKAENNFNKTKYRDKIKDQYAKDNGYKLYRIKWFGNATNENIKKLNLELEKILKENNLI